MLLNHSFFCHMCLLFINLLSHTSVTLRLEREDRRKHETEPQSSPLHKFYKMWMLIFCSWFFLLKFDDLECSPSIRVFLSWRLVVWHIKLKSSESSSVWNQNWVDQWPHLHRIKPWTLNLFLQNSLSSLDQTTCMIYQNDEHVMLIILIPCTLKTVPVWPLGEEDL